MEGIKYLNILDCMLSYFIFNYQLKWEIMLNSYVYKSMLHQEQFQKRIFTYNFFQTSRVFFEIHNVDINAGLRIIELR